MAIEILPSKCALIQSFETTTNLSTSLMSQVWLLWRQSSNVIHPRSVTKIVSLKIEDGWERCSSYHQSINCKCCYTKDTKINDNKTKKAAFIQKPRQGSNSLARPLVLRVKVNEKNVEASSKLGGAKKKKKGVASTSPWLLSGSGRP